MNNMEIKYKQEDLYITSITNFCEVGKEELDIFLNLINDKEQLKLVLEKYSLYFSTIYFYIKDYGDVYYMIDVICKTDGMLHDLLFNKDFPASLIDEIIDCKNCLSNNYYIYYYDKFKLSSIFSIIFQSEELFDILIKNYKKFLIKKDLCK